MILAKPYPSDARVYPEAQSLIKEGHEITLLSWDKNANNPKKETLDGINVIRSPNSKFMDMLPYDIFRLHWWWKKGYRDALKLFEETHFDVVHCHDLSSLPIGVTLKKKLDVKLVYDAHEIWGYMISRDMPTFISNYAFKIEKKLVPKVDHVITAENTYNTYFETLGCDSITSILNCKDLMDTTYHPPENNVFTIVYIGVLNRSRFFPENIKILGKINKVKFVIAGKKENMYHEVEELSKQYQNIKFLGTIPYNQVISETMKADVILCMIKPNDINNKIASANKQFEAMVCGRPIICTKDTRSGEITKEESCGLVVEYSEEGLKEAIIKLRDSPALCEELGKNALHAAVKKYNWAIEEKKLLNVYDKVAK